MSTCHTPGVDRHKVGDSFARVLSIPPEFADGYFAHYTPSSQLRTSTGELVAQCVCTWLDAATTRQLHLLVQDTTAWPADAVLSIDVQFVRTADGYTLSTSTATVRTVRDVTRGAAP